ncbi:hypothetical protein ACIRBX_13725 [Kitasatospora sp. NPDC096147]|uniref:hypothetical protein n=1 Tax=Kitasatospora sp. NPDC096147 TaxID=3364093 RepID=UPI0038169A32
MDALGVVVGLGVLFVVALLIMLTVGAVKAGKAAARKISQQEANARRAIETATLKAKTFAKPGAPGQISAVRLALRTSLDSTRKVLAAGAVEDSQLAESLQLLTRLDAHAAELDGELKALELEPDAGRVADKLPALRERAERITHAAESMRWAAQDRMQRFADEELARLADECETEAGALRHWDTGLPSAGGAGASSGAGSAPGAASRATSGSAAGASAAGSTGRPERKAISNDRPATAEQLLGLAVDLTQRLRKS